MIFGKWATNTWSNNSMLILLSMLGVLLCLCLVCTVFMIASIMYSYHCDNLVCLQVHYKASYSALLRSTRNMASCAKATSYSCKLDNQIVTLRKCLVPASLSCNDDILARCQPKAVMGHQLSSKESTLVSSRGSYYYVHRSRKQSNSILNPALFRVSGSSSSKTRHNITYSNLSYNTLPNPESIVLFAKSEILYHNVVPPTTDLPSPAQLSFILDKLRNEVCSWMCYMHCWLCLL